MTVPALTPADFHQPAVLLSGTVDYAMYQSFRSQLGTAPADGLVAIELSTLGGDPEVARMMGEDVRFHTELEPQRRFAFLGKAAIYSAGTTFMSFFARENRYLTRGTRMMVHERHLTRTVNLDSPLSLCLPQLEAVQNEIRASIAIQEEGFRNLVAGSSLSFEDLVGKARTNWYIEASEAQSLGLIEGII